LDSQTTERNNNSFESEQMKSMALSPSKKKNIELDSNDSKPKTCVHKQIPKNNVGHFKAVPKKIDCWLSNEALESRRKMRNTMRATPNSHVK